MSSLFEPLTLRGMTARNRIWLAAMCQYSCFSDDGIPDDWHLVHLGARATGGFGLLITEATAVSPEGRISPQDTGLWNDEQTAAWKRITDFAHSQGAVIGVQLAHAGRKASVYSEIHELNGSIDTADGGWTTYGPSDEAFTGLRAPEALTAEGIAQVVDDFADAAVRAHAAGFDTIEIHAAHGYLMHQFLSPFSNKRTDAYGGSFENRIRILVETVDAMRAVWPEEKPLLVRLSASEWFEGGFTVEDSAHLAKILGEHGVDLIDVSSGGNHIDAPIVVGPGYQVPFSRDVRALSGMPTGAVGMITDPAYAQEVVDSGAADVVLLARAALREPAWPLRAAHELGVAPRQAPYPPAYGRGAWRHDR